MLTPIKKLLSLLSARDKRNAVFLLIMMMIGAVLEVVGVAAIPAFVAAVVDPEKVRQYQLVAEVMDRFSINTTDEIVIWGGLALFAVFVVKNGFLLLNYHWQTRYVANRRRDLSRRVAHAYLHAPYIFHLKRNSAEIVRNVNREVAVLANQTMAPLLELITRVMILVCVLGFLFLVEPLVTLFWVAFLAVVGGIGTLALSGKLQEYGQLEQAEGRTLLQALQQASGGFKELKVANREAYFAEKISAAVGAIAETIGYKQFIGKATSPVLEVVAVAGLLALSAWLVLAGRSTEDLIVTLSLFVVGLVRMRETLSAAVSHLTNLRYSLVSVDPIYNHLRLLEPDTNRRAAASRTAIGFEREIAMRDLWYRYDPEHDYALKGIDVSIAKGSAVAFVGSSGAGKSTLVDTILALLDPDRGGVFLDGTDIRELGVEGWQAAIGYVPQAIYLLDDTIRRNIAFGVPDDEIDEAAVVNAVEMAQLQQFVARQREGLDTPVGERGARLSGGERQRIGIARALYTNPQVLIFDEATSALDNTTERAVIAAVDKLKGSRTVIMIAHRLSTVRNCDILHFLKNGKIEASGSYDELEAQHGEFRLMAAI